MQPQKNNLKKKALVDVTEFFRCGVSRKSVIGEGKVGGGGGIKEATKLKTTWTAVVISVMLWGLLLVEKSPVLFQAE